jgi:hypothetical protein
VDDAPQDNAKPSAGLSDVKHIQVEGLKAIGQSFCDACDWIGPSSEMSLAKIRMQEAVFWAVEHIQK